MSWNAAKRALTAAHPYEVPEIIALEPAAINCAYRAWVLENVVLTR